MPPVFSKLNLKDESPILVLDAPSSFEPELAALAGVHVLRAVPSGTEPPVTFGLAFALAFASTQQAVDAVATTVAPRMPGDAKLWIAYPKQSSKRYSCEFNRDTGWAAIGRAGFEAVRQVAIDEDWSALRFRRTEFIASMTRAAHGRISPAGKARGTGGDSTARG